MEQLIKIINDNEQNFSVIVDEIDLCVWYLAELKHVITLIYLSDIGVENVYGEKVLEVDILSRITLEST